MPNRLASATSPYLLQHAQNPVDWWEWSPEAFDEAKRRDVPVLLSVGYAACHWCHVMAHESFEDAETAAQLNRDFVSIKVDREERPDVDAVYIQVASAMTGHAGWPLTCVLDHEGHPFFAGTYLPDRPRQGQPSFRQVLGAVSEAWRDRPDDVRRVTSTLREHLNKSVTAPPRAIDEAALEHAVATLAGDFDQRNGGFGGAPKFPPSMVLEFLARHADRTGDPAARRMHDETLTAMARGGLYDQLGGGFARYSVDAEWVVPHFEKMLYDNGQLLGLYARWDDPLGERVAAETAEFLLRELRTAEGGFASALDADTDGEEGKFYAWTPAQLADVLGADDGAWAAEVFGVTAAGTFEAGPSTLQLRADPADLGRLADVRERLASARETRTRPARDDKVVTGWNGLAISGLCAHGLGSGEHRWIEAAVDAARLILDVHLVDGRLLRVSRDGVAGAHAGVLEDYGLFASALIDLTQATGDAEWLNHGGLLLGDALDRFAADDGGFHDTAADAETLISRPRDPSDNASPSGLSAMVHALLGYSGLTGSGRHAEAAERALQSVAMLAEQAPRFAGWSLAAAEATIAGPEEIVVVGAHGAERDALAEVARRRRSAVVVVTEPGRDDIPLLVGRDEVDGRPAAYVCRQLVCERPVTDPAEL